MSYLYARLMLKIELLSGMKSIPPFFSSRVPQSRINHADELDLDKVGWLKSSGSNRTSFVAPPEIFLSERYVEYVGTHATFTNECQE